VDQSIRVREGSGLGPAPCCPIETPQASGNGGRYLLIGCAGGFLLHSLMIWHPAAIDPAYLPAGIDPIAQPLKVFPAMVSASLEALTTLSNGVSRPGDLASRVCCLTIAILGQLYVAMLIGLILGRFNQTMRR
jgi:hypothetical protein